MNRIITRVAAALCLISAFSASTAWAQTRLTAGREFQELRPPRPVSTGAKIEVLEFFYYGCPVCYETQPHLAKWLFTRGADVTLIRVPAVSSEGWESFARTYYALEAMGQLGRLHWPVYDNHHFDGKQLNEEKNVLAWVESNGLDGKQFSMLWNSPETKAKIDSAQKALETYSIRGVPTFVVDGKYVTSARMANGVPQMVSVLDVLVTRARNERPR